MEIKTIENPSNLFIFTFMFGFSIISKAAIVHETSADSRGIERIFHQKFLLRHTRAITEQNENSNQISEESKLQFIEPPKNVTLDIGSAHIMHCKASISNAQIFWVKENNVLECDYPLPNLKLFENNTLWIQKMDFHLSGIYSCIAILPTEAISVKANIRVRNKPEEMNSCEIVLSRIPNNSTFIEGEFANLVCLTTDQNVHISWEKNGEPLHSTKHITVMRSGTIFFAHVKLEDSGEYACVARDIATGCTKKAYAMLNINHRENLEKICGIVRAKEAEENMDIARIAGGRTAAKGSHPWQVLLTMSNNVSCGGVLLNHRWIATAAHCFYRNRKKINFRWAKMKIILGENDRNIKEQEFQTHIAHFSSVVIHPNFNIKTVRHDIALVRLKDTVRFTDYIIPICIGSRELGEYVFKSSVKQTNVVFGKVTGWGYHTFQGNSSRFLQEIVIPVVDKKLCKEMLDYLQQLGETAFCAGYGKEGSQEACQGDSGSPFAVQHDGRWFLAGLVSVGEGCKSENHFVLFTKVSSYYDWINAIIKS